jgi:hypothetical protein
MDSTAIKESKLKKLDRDLVHMSFATVATGVMVLLVPVACYFLFHYGSVPDVNTKRYDSLVSACKVGLFALLPCIAIFLLFVGFRILHYLRKRKNLLKDTYIA